MKITALLLISSLLFSCTGEAQIYPNKNWSSNENPSISGWGNTRRSIFTRYVTASTNSTGLIIVHKGEIVLEYGDIVENSNIAFCRKSVLALFFGKYVENGNINLDKTLLELDINDVSEPLPIEKKAKLKDLISAKSGIFLSGANGGDFRRYAPEWRTSMLSWLLKLKVTIAGVIQFKRK